MRGFRTSAIRAGITAAVLLSPVLAFLIVIVAEALADLLIELGFPVLLDLMALGALAWALFRRWKEPALPSGLEEVSDAPAVAAHSG